MKKVLLLFILIILSGCTSSANIIINSDLTIDENVEVTFSNDKASNYYSPKEYAYQFLNYYNSAISLKKYDYKVEEKTDTTSVIFTKNSKDICDAINYNLFSQFLYKSVSCTQNEYYYIIQSDGEQLISKPQSEKKFNIEELNLNIKLPVVPEENNADLVNDLTYTWKYDRNTESNKNIYIKLSKEKLESNKKMFEENTLKQKKNNRIYLSLILITGVIIIVTISLRLYKKYKNNKLEY